MTTTADLVERYKTFVRAVVIYRDEDEEGSHPADETSESTPEGVPEDTIDFLGYSNEHGQTMTSDGKIHVDSPTRLCLCGCGSLVAKKYHFRRGHVARIKGIMDRMDAGDLPGSVLPRVLVNHVGLNPEFTIAGRRMRDYAK